MSKLLTLDAAIKYDGDVPDRKSVKVVPHEDLAIVQVSMIQGSVNSAKWGKELASDIANVRTINGLGSSSTPTWEPVVGRADMGALTRFVGLYGGLTSGWQDPVCFAAAQAVLRWAWKGDKDAIALIAGESKIGVDRFLEMKIGAADYDVWCFKGEQGQTVKRIVKDDETGKDLFSIEGTPNGLRVVLNFRPIQPRVLVRTTGVEIVTNNLLDFARLSFLRDHLLGRTRVCENPGCFAPYFVYRRRRQIYCSHDCAVAAASRNYRRRVRELVEEAKAKGKWKK